MKSALVLPPVHQQGWGNEQFAEVRPTETKRHSANRWRPYRHSYGCHGQTNPILCYAAPTMDGAHPVTEGGMRVSGEPQLQEQLRQGSRPTLPSLPAPPYASQIREEQPNELDLAALKHITLLLVAPMVARHFDLCVYAEAGRDVRASLECTDVIHVPESPFLLAPSETRDKGRGISRRPRSATERRASRQPQLPERLPTIW